MKLIYSLTMKPLTDNFEETDDRMINYRPERKMSFLAIQPFKNGPSQRGLADPDKPPGFRVINSIFLLVSRAEGMQITYPELTLGLEVS
jgi:hypothetical protein